MQLRRALPLSLVALLASSGCVSVGADTDPAPAPGTSAPLEARDPAGASPPTAGPDLPPPVPESRPLPLGRLPQPDGEPDAERPPAAAAAAARPPAARNAKPPAAPRRAHPPQPAPPRGPRQPAPLPRPDELCAAAEGTVPPSIVDLCIRQYGR
ncbi:hypothetical protein [Streptomyces sp. NBC_01296]|uniref:hypothetical protein n=1 Tax=Streptomyces sp. NBC_01296 TaxID=2903816 RepID=UPI002E109778|nr:hypothetical protein OG299_34525 [Streptomyces sp. NBC_01296]WSW58052.1 hypothetical protein OG513_05395 [Streptomyces sp. NBC_00998]